MDGDTVHVSLLAAATPLRTSSAIAALRPWEVRLPSSESAARLGRVRLRQRPTRGEGATTPPSPSQRGRCAR
jgi:hypothetical protein